jgi:rSAM/selenodomain-associated transferase 2
VNVAIIMPVLNEAGARATVFEQHLQQLQSYRGGGNKLIIVDGGSNDNTFELAQRYADRVVQCDRGRAVQMNAGARHADADILLFLHADTLLPSHALEAVIHKISEGHHWGRFNVRLSGDHFMFRIIESMMNLRSCITGIATGDQAVFVRRETFESVGGYPQQPLMEDVELSKRLRGLGWPACLQQQVVTSSRRWREFGIVRTVLLMWRLRLAYFLGVSAERLAEQYRHG